MIDSEKEVGVIHEIGDLDQFTPLTEAEHETLKQSQKKEDKKDKK